MRSQDIFPLARQLYAEIPERQRHWRGEPADAPTRDQLADHFLMACDAVGFDVGEEAHRAAMVISEALGGFLTRWGGRYGDLDNEVHGAQAALVTILGGTVQAPGVYQLRVGTPITVSAIAGMIAFVLMLELEEEPRC
jgi:hypothetical protein